VTRSSSLTATGIDPPIAELMLKEPK